jgi:hypothetical protein
MRSAANRHRIPAGTFDAIKLEYKSSGGSGTTCWHAPEVRPYVKCVSASNPPANWEIVKFELTQ